MIPKDIVKIIYLKGVLRQFKLKQEAVNNAKQSLKKFKEQIRQFVITNRDKLPVIQNTEYNYRDREYYQINDEETNLQIRWQEFNGEMENFTIRKWKTYNTEGEKIDETPQTEHQCCKCDKPATIHTIDSRGEHYFCWDHDPAISAWHQKRMKEIKGKQEKDEKK